MKAFLKYLKNLVISSLFVLGFGCGSDVSLKQVVGSYKSKEFSKVMGGSKISSYSTLEIKLDTIVNPFMNNSKRVEFKYFYKTYVSDQMYGTINKVMEKGGGDLEMKIKKNKIYLKTPAYSDGFGATEWFNKGAHIEIPEEQLSNNYVNNLIVRFKNNRGDPIKFFRLTKSNIK